MSQLRMVQASVADSFPISLICLSDGTIMLVPQWRFGLIVDQKIGDGVWGIFTDECFSLMGPADTTFQDYQYSYPYKYKEMPVLKGWLMQQNLISPL